jgi:predicted N-acetyltransferase YhbS
LLERKAVTAVFSPLVSQSPVSIEQEKALDIYAREALLDRAMGPGRKRKASEKLRRGRLPAEGLSFVARDTFGNLVGTVRLWNVITGNGVRALLLGPLAVAPEHKGAGVGSALMRHAVEEAARLEHGAILLVGDAPYYGQHVDAGAVREGPVSGAGAEGWRAARGGGDAGSGGAEVAGGAGEGRGLRH